MIDNKQIKHVAIYLRKSRDEGEYDDVLSKHRDTLLAIAKSKDWTFKLYEEVASGEKIESRKEMQKLLNHVEENLYDGVLVMDIDRLGRGDNKDWAVIKDTFLISDTLIITPSRIYDLEVENDDMSFDFMSIFAKLEYKTIKRRMQQGKVAGAKKGMWTNGKPPFPYYYDKNIRMVLVDETKRPIYRAIVDKYLGGVNLNEIAIWLTKQEITTPYNIKPNGKDKGWSNITIQRLLVSETHLGLITYGRTRTTKRGQLEIVPDEERLKVKGTHEQLKTQEEHDQITDRLLKNRLISPSARKSTLPLSGLLYCDKCGYKMQFKVGSSKGRGQFWSTLCTHGYKDGSKCEQKGKILDDEFFNALFERIIRIDKNVLSELESFGTCIHETKTVIEIKEQELTKQKRALEKIQESYEEDTITKQKYLERKGVRTNQIQKLEEELKNLHITLAVEGEVPTTKQIFDRIDTFKEQWVNAATPEEKNKALKKLVERIVYNREDNRIELTVSYR